jgi:hypothetical protein
MDTSILQETQFATEICNSFYPINAHNMKNVEMQWVRCMDMMTMLAGYPVYPAEVCRLHYLAMLCLCWLRFLSVLAMLASSAGYAGWQCLIRCLDILAGLAD